MLDALVRELSDRYGLGDRSRDLFGLLMGYIYNDRRGGFDGFVESFRQQGHGDLLASWLGGDARRQRPLTASDVGMVFGQGLLSDWGGRIGASRATVAAAIAGILPRLVGELTPGGRLPGGFGTAPALAGMRGNEAIDNDITPALDTPATVSRPARTTDDKLRRDVPAAEKTTETAVQFDNRHEGDRLRRVDVRFEPTSITPIDPHVAAITAAVAGPARATPSFAADEPLGDFEFRRPPEKRKRSGFGWLFWLLLLLAAGAGGGYYYWLGFPPLGSLQLPWAARERASAPDLGAGITVAHARRQTQRAAHRDAPREG